MRFIRWQGLIAFFVIVALMAVGWFLFADRLVKRGIEATGTKINGAKVEILKADLSFRPLGLTLEGVQVTDREEPMKNLFQIGRIAFLMDTGGIFLGKLVVDEMSIDGVRVNTERRASGAISKQPEERSEEKAKSADSGFGLPSLDVPDVKTILEGEDLETLKSIDALKRELEEGDVRWKTRIKELPDKTTADAYKKRFEAVKLGFKGGTTEKLKSIEDASKLRDDIRKNLDTLEGAKKELKEELSSLKSRIAELKALPEKDLNHLKEKYSLSSEGMANFSRILFGPEIEGQLRWGMAWHRKLSPYVKRAMDNPDKGVEDVKRERSRGVDVRFREFAPRPDFWIRNIRATLTLPAGELSGKIIDVTSDQKLIGRPTRYIFTGEKLKSFDAIKLDGEFSTLGKEGAENLAKLKLSGGKLERLELSKKADFPVALAGGRADYALDTVVGAKGFNVDFSGNFSRVSIESGPKEGGGRLIRALSSSLAGINAFSVSGKARGTPEDYDISLRSDIDELLKVAVSDALKKELDRFEAELKNKLEAKVRAPMEELNAKMGGLVDMDALMASNFKDLDALKEAVEKQKDEAEKKLKGGLEEKAAPKLQDLKKKLKLPF